MELCGAPSGGAAALQEKQRSRETHGRDLLQPQPILRDRGDDRIARDSGSPGTNITADALEPIRRRVFLTGFLCL